MTIELRGELRGELALVIKLLQRKLGSLSEEMKGKIMDLPVERLEVLAEELLDFAEAEELISWMNQNG
jgi:Domain of unknown function (DUF4351)